MNTRTGIVNVKKTVISSVFGWSTQGSIRSNRPQNSLQRKRQRMDVVNTQAENVSVDSNKQLQPMDIDMVLHDHLYSKPTLESQILETKKKIEELEKEIQLLRLEKFGLERFSSDCELIRFYTGFRSYECLKAIFIWLERTSQTLVTWSQVQQSGVSPVDF